jgi:hypothetical protein
VCLGRSWPIFDATTQENERVLAAHSLTFNLAVGEGAGEFAYQAPVGAFSLHLNAALPYGSFNGKRSAAASDLAAIKLELRALIVWLTEFG